MKVQTVEEQVRAAAEHKLGVANQSITAGFFDNNTRLVGYFAVLNSGIFIFKNSLCLVIFCLSQCGRSKRIFGVTFA